MNSNTLHTRVLEKIRNRYQSIRLLTLDTLAEADGAAIPELMSNREVLLTAIGADRAKIAGAVSSPEQSGTILLLQNEIEGIIRSIVEIDKQLKQFITYNLSALSNEMSHLFTSSRAASAYTTQSRQ